MQNQIPDAGMGRIGRLEQKLAAEDFLTLVKESLKCDHLRVSGDLGRPVSKIAVCGGSGSGLLKAAHRQGAEVLVTGDVKYHEARQAEELGMLLVDAGHFATERLVITELSAALRQASQVRGWALTVEEYTGEKDPFRVY